MSLQGGLLMDHPRLQGIYQLVELRMQQVGGGAQGVVDLTPRAEPGDGWIGLEVRGLEVTRVSKNGPAERAGLRTGDVLLRLDGKAAAEGGLEAALGALAPGQVLRLAVRRGAETLDLAVTLERRPVF